MSYSCQTRGTCSVNKKLHQMLKLRSRLKNSKNSSERQSSSVTNFTLQIIYRLFGFNINKDIFSYLSLFCMITIVYKFNKIIYYREKYGY
ncbi:hypothetical protein XIS1_1700031 [Xenorhabdus innexi]|uniref:Uncharacterized protein n=1 Tax=Xenorhabdus innexi TaxID=290109 RepID=A0A1N6MVX9_9GAMM|nr:hypothetical protein XIS1_1700031 [Xenorhabdus innexi]